MLLDIKVYSVEQICCGASQTRINGMNELSFNNSIRSLDHTNNGYSTQNICMYILILLTGIFACIGNGITLAIIKKYPALRTHEDSAALYLILFLAVADGLNGLGGVVSGICKLYLELTHGFPTRGQCILCSQAHTFGNYCSQIMLISVAVDRLIAVRDPLGYQAKNHFRYAYCSFIFTILYSLLSFFWRIVTGDLGKAVSKCIVVFVTPRSYRLYWVSFQLLSSLTIIGLYTVLVALMHRKTVQSRNMNQTVNTRLLRRQTLVTKAVAKVLLIYLLVWVFPICLSFGATILNFKLQVTAFLPGVLGIGSNVSAGANIFVYTYKIPLMKAYYKKFFRLETNSANAAVGPIAFCQGQQLQQWNA